MQLRSRQLVVLFVLMCAGVASFARTHKKKSGHAAAKQGKPVVQSVEPPNWWSAMPNPMLLLHGKNLTGAAVDSSVAGISVRRTRVSANGHWVFVWLDISAAPPQHFSLLVHTDQGKLRVPYELDKRHAPTDGFQGFSASDVMYLLMPDRFADGDTSNDNLPQMKGTFNRNDPNAYHGGDLAGIENHLDYLHTLGATTLWITPLYAQDAAAPADYSGYAPVDMYRVNPHFGSLQDYENLTQSVHAQGMKVVLDMVLNHVGPKSSWVLDPPAPDWFHGTPAQHMEATTDFAPLTDPHAPRAALLPAVDGWIFNTLPDLNQSNPQVKQYLIQNAIWWIESGALDGLRLDTFPHVDRSFWQDMHAELHALYPHLTTVGEVLSADPTVDSYFAGGVKHNGVDTGLYTTFDFPGFFALRAALAGPSPTGDQPMTRLTDVGRQDWLYPHPERLVTFFGNQDSVRFLSQPGATVGRMKLAFGLIATMRGMPQIYYGDEIALSAGNGADNRPDFPGGFSGDKNNAFAPAGRTAQQEEMHAWVQGLLQLRAQHSVLQAGQQQNLLADNAGMVFVRFAAPSTGRATPAAAPGEMMVVAMNKSDGPRTFHLDFSGTALDGVQALLPAWNGNGPIAVNHDTCDVTVGAGDLIVFTAQR